MSIDRRQLIDDLNSLRKVSIYDFSSHLRESISPAKGLPKGPYIVPQRRTPSSDKIEVVKGAFTWPLNPTSQRSVDRRFFRGIARSATQLEREVQNRLHPSPLPLRYLDSQKLRSMSQISVSARLKRTASTCQATCPPHIPFYLIFLSHSKIPLTGV